MAKRGAQQLQTEIATKEELENFLSQDGLLVLDVYSRWFGPCVALVGCLRKVKMEIAGDDLKLGTVRCDDIKELKRFRNNSEPVWLFLWKDKVVNSFFGSNVPALTELLIEELEIKKDPSMEMRAFYELSEMTAIEIERSQIETAKQREIERNKKETGEKDRLDYLTFVTDEIMSHHSDMGVTIFMPHVITRDLYRRVTSIADKRHLAAKEKISTGITAEQFSIINLEAKEFPNDFFQHLKDKEVLMVCWKLPDDELRPVQEILADFISCLTVEKEDNETEVTPEDSDDDSEPPLLLKSLSVFLEKIIDDGSENETNGIINKIVDEIVEPIPELVARAQGSKTRIINSIVDELIETVHSSNSSASDPNERSGSQDKVKIPAIWTPTNQRTNAALIYLYFRILTEHFLPPDPIPDPPHVAMSFSANKRYDVIKTSKQCEAHVLAYGFFSSDEYKTAQLLADSNSAYNKRQPNVYDRLIVKVKLIGKESHAFLTLAAHDPSYVSLNTDEGQIECEHFFPKGYMNGPELDDSDMDIHSNVEDGNDEGVENNDGEKNEGEQEKEHVAAEPE